MGPRGGGAGRSGSDWVRIDFFKEEQLLEASAEQVSLSMAVCIYAHLMVGSREAKLVDPPSWIARMQQVRLAARRERSGLPYAIDVHNEVARCMSNSRTHDMVQLLAFCYLERAVLGRSACGFLGNPGVRLNESNWVMMWVMCLDLAAKAYYDNEVHLSDIYAVFGVDGNPAPSSSTLCSAERAMVRGGISR